MGFLDSLLGLVGGGGKVDFGNLDPNSVESYWRADHLIDQAERKGPAELAATLAKLGLRDMRHWEKVKAALAERHKDNPDFAMAASRVGYEMQMASVSSQYQMPPEYATPPHGITLDRYAGIRARLELGHPLDTVLREAQLDPARWSEVDRTWSWRMGPQADMFASQILSSTYFGMYQQALAVYRRS